MRTIMNECRVHRAVVSIFAVPVVLVLAACQPVPDTSARRSVIVSGEAEIAVAPEIATVRLAIEARDRELSTAQAEASKVVDGVLKLTDSLEIPRKQVQSAMLHVQPEYDWQDGAREFRGYLVQREISVRLEDLSGLGPLIERALDAGVNNVMPPELGVKDSRRLHREVLALAAADAKKNAEALAQTLEAALGKVQHVSAVDAPPPMPMQRMERAFMQATDSGQAERSYETGRIVMRARVQAEFELK